ALAALRHIRELISCQQTTIEIFGPDSKTQFQLAADSRGSKAEAWYIDERWIEALMPGNALVIADLETSTEQWPALQDLKARGFSSLMSLPLMVRGELLGALNLIATDAGALTHDFAEIAGEVADELAIAIQQARLFETERDQRTLAEALRDTAAALTSTVDTDTVMARILDNVGRVVPHTAANIMLIEENTARAVYRHGYTAEQPDHAGPIPLNTPILQQLMNTGQP